MSLLAIDSRLSKHTDRSHDIFFPALTAILQVRRFDKIICASPNCVKVLKQAFLELGLDYPKGRGRVEVLHSEVATFTRAVRHAKAYGVNRCFYVSNSRAGSNGSSETMWATADVLGILCRTFFVHVTADMYLDELIDTIADDKKKAVDHIYPWE